MWLLELAEKLNSVLKSDDICGHVKVEGVVAMPLVKNQHEVVLVDVCNPAAVDGVTVPVEVVHPPLPSYGISERWPPQEA